MCARMVWVFDEAKGHWVQTVVFTPESEWELTRAEEYHLPSTYYNVTPTYNCAVLRPGPAPPGAEGDDEVLRFERARWGIEGGPGMGHNARVENLHRSGMWRPRIGKHHGLIVADGFYEWDTTAGRKQPYFIQRKDGQPMLMAALYQPPPTDGRDQPGGGLDDRVRATVITCPANDLVGTLHDRMPVIIEPEAARDWVEEKDESLLVPAQGVLEMHPVTTDVNKSTNNRPDLIEPIEVAGGTQSRLF